MRTITLDWDLQSDISALFNQVKSRFFELKRVTTGTPSRKERSRRILDACQQIWRADISSVCSALSLDAQPRYYVYAHLDTSRRIAVGFAGVTTFAATLGLSYFPFYVGKGTGDRCSEINRNETHRKTRERMQRLGKTPKIFRILENLTEVEALQYEAKLIDIFGLITLGGSLCNLDEGLAPERRRLLYMDSFLELRHNRNFYKVTHVDGACTHA